MALRLCNRGRLLSVRPAPTLFDHLYASLHKAFGRSISASLPKPQTPFPRERLCMLGWLCIVQSPCAYTPGIRAGLSVGLPPLVQARMLAVSHTKPLHDAVAQMADDLYGGYAPKQGCFGCLPKVLHDAKPAEQATLDAPFL